jgi:hypothetical protein
VVDGRLLPAFSPSRGRCSALCALARAVKLLSHWPLMDLTTMQRYYFDLKFNGESPSHDEEGTILKNQEAAQLEATRSLCDFSKDILDSEMRLRNVAVIVRDDTGPVLEAVLNFYFKRLN